MSRFTQETIYFAAGCFWGAQLYFDQFESVKTQVGYANGPTEDPSYQDVCANSGHAETVKVMYYSEIIRVSYLIDRFFDVIDPLSVNKQGGDIGVQYRTGIYYTTEYQKECAEKKFAEMEAKLGQKLAVELKPIENFYPAEEYHQDYLRKNPGGYCHIPRSKMGQTE